MPLKQTALKDFLKLAPSDKDEFGQNVVNELTADAAGAKRFSSLPFAVSVLGQTNAELHKAIAMAMGGDHNLIDQRDAAVKTWDLQFGKTADYVSIVADGDPVVITSAGFTPTKASRDKKGKPGAARIKKVTPGTGSAEIEVDAQTEVEAFLYVLAPADGATVAYSADGTITITVGDKKVYVKCDTHRSVVIGGLSDDARLQVAVQPINTAGTGPAATGATVRPQ